MYGVTQVFVFFCCCFHARERSSFKQLSFIHLNSLLTVPLLSCHCSHLWFGTFRHPFISYRVISPSSRSLAWWSFPWQQPKLQLLQFRPWPLDCVDEEVALLHHWKGVTFFHVPLSLQRRLQKKIIRLQKVYFDVCLTKIHNFFTGTETWILSHVDSKTNCELYLLFSDKIMSQGKDAKELVKG